MNYKVLRSNRKTLSVEVTRGLEIIVRAPKGLGDHSIEKFIMSHEKWISEKLNKQAELQKLYPELSSEEKEMLRYKAKQYILPRINDYAKIMNLYPESVKITSAQKRFGSCSSRNNICFSLYLMRYPKDAVDYVIVHELAHIQEKNHSKNFYALVEKILPDYKDRQKLLKK